MGERMRGHDWSDSPLGPPDGWPVSLRVAANLMLNSKVAMFLAWGDDLAFLYNDAYAGILGAKHPDALGRPFAAVWPEIWPDVEPMVAKAMAGEATFHENLHLVMERNGYPEDTWYTFSYSPVHDEGGAVRGMHCACSETTGQVLAERSLREGEARWRGLFQIMQEGFVVGEVVRAPTGEAVDWRYVEVNGGWERLTGIPVGRAAGRLVTEVIPGIERRWIDTLVRVAETGEPAHFEEYAAPLDQWFEVAAYRSGPGRFAVLFLNTTDRRAAQERQALLLREIDHRAKNALAVVQAMLRLTKAQDVPEFIKAVEGRVAALARAHTLLASQQWEGSSLRDLLRGELAPFIAGRATLDGPAVTLPAVAAQPVAMAVHELATNAAKHGALSRPAGAVSVSWRIDGGRLRLRWAESGGPPVPGAPKRHGFGSRLLDTTIRQQLSGTVAKTWAEAGLVCDIDLLLAHGGKDGGQQSPPG